MCLAKRVRSNGCNVLILQFSNLLELLPFRSVSFSRVLITSKKVPTSVSLKPMEILEGTSILLTLILANEREEESCLIIHLLISLAWLMIDFSASRF
jgi:hypothetical protein